METVFSKIAGATVFAKFDLKSAFWQIELDEESKKMTTINTTKGLYKFERLPFGIKTASAIFQRTMDKICSGLEGIIIYQDDVLVYAKSNDELNKRTEALLIRLNKRNVTINWNKSIRCTKEINFLGHIVNEFGIKPDNKLVDKVKKMEAPQTKKEVEHFIGLINFYGTNIQNFAEKCESINCLRKSGTPFIWKIEQQQAFDKLKEELSSGPIVKPYDLNKEVTVTCDASEKAIGAIIS